MNYDYLKELKNIIELLRSEEATSIANDIQDALDYSSVSSELLMRSKLILENLKAEEISNRTYDKASSIIKEIERILS